MNKNILSLIVLITLNIASVVGQCQTALVRQRVQNFGTNQTGTFLSQNIVYTTERKDSAGIRTVKFYIYENNTWSALPTFTTKNMNSQLSRWKNKIICINTPIYGNQACSFDNLTAPMGYHHSIVQLKNGAWDTLQGALIESSSEIIRYATTDNDLYYCISKSISGSFSCSIFKYDTTNLKFNSLAYTDELLSDILPTKNRLYIINTTAINGKATNGFAFIENDSIFDVKDTFFKKPSIDFSYIIDYDKNCIMGVDFKSVNNTTIKYFSRSTFYTRTNTQFNLPNGASSFSFSGSAVTGKIAYLVGNNVQNISYYMVLCDSSSQWQSTSGLKNSDWSLLMIYKDTIYITNNVDHHTYIFENGSNISGKMYIDDNQNCVLNSNDFQLKTEIIEFRKLNSSVRYMTTTDTNANYVTNLYNDTFLLVGPNELSACSDDTIVLPKPSTTDLSIKAPTGIAFYHTKTSTRRVRWTLTGSSHYSLKNKGATIDSLHYLLSYSNGIRLNSSSSNQILINDSTMLIRFGKINYYERKSLDIIFDLDTSIYHIGDSFWGKSTITAYQNSNTLTQYDSIKYRVVYSYDPNHKSVNRTLVQPLLDTRLDYLIEFQNEGNDDAYDVVIRDTLPWSLNPATFAITEYSHPFELQINKQILTFTFRDIFLKPKSQNEPKSKGFISYKIDSRYGIKNGDSIRNRAFIYFDLNAPVVTNYAVTKASDKVVSVSRVTNNETPLSVFPNPGSSIISITGKGPINIYNSEGRLIKSFSESTLEVNASDWQMGLYLISDGTSYVKFVKM